MTRSKLSRRGILQAIGAAGALGALPGLPLLASGCADDPTETPPAAGPKTVKKRLHFAFKDTAPAGRVPLTAAMAPRIELRVGRKRYGITAHTAASLKGAFTDRLFDPERAALTHYVDDVELSVDGAQSYHVLLHASAGPPVLLLGGIHVPTAAERAAALGLVTGPAIDDDPAHIVSLDDAAVWAVFHDPSVMALDAEVAADVIAHIERCPSYRLLTKRIAELFYATTPEEAESGDVGWINALYRLDQTGKKMPLTDYDGTVLKDAQGRPAFQYEWVPEESVAAATHAVIAEVNERFHDDVKLEGVKYFTPPGVTTAGAAALTAVGEHGESFAFEGEGVAKSARTVNVEPLEGRKFKVKVRNDRALGALFGYAERTASGELRRPKALGYVPATHYTNGAFSFFGPSTGEAELTLGADAASAALYTTALGFRAGDYDPAFLDHAIATWLLDMLVDFAIPVTVLAMGTGGHAATTAQELVAHYLLERGIDAIAELAAGAITAVMNLPAGQNVGQVFLELSKDLLKIGLSAVTNLMGTAALSGVGVILISVGGASAAEAMIPIVGWAIKLVGIAQTAGQLVLAGAGAVVNQMVTVSNLVLTHTVRVTIVPKKEQGVFTPRARFYQLTLTPSGDRLPIRRSGAFDPLRPAITVDVTEVPILGVMTVAVRLYESASQGAADVAFGAYKGPNLGDPSAHQEIDVEIRSDAAPITATTRLVHDRMLHVFGAGHGWRSPDDPPTTDDTALDCGPTSVLVCGLTSLTVAQRQQLVGYNFSARCGGGGLSYLAHSVSMLNPVTTVAQRCGLSTPSLLVLSLGDVHAILAPMPPGPDGKVKVGVFPYTPDAPQAIDLATFAPKVDDPRSVASLFGTQVTHARIHPASNAVVALTDAGVEVAYLTAARGLREGTPSLFSRRGSRLGQLAPSSVAVAPFHGTQQYAVLEESSRRVQSFDFAGRPVRAFGGDALALRTDAGRKYLDLDLDAAGRAWVLSIQRNGGAAATFSLDVYGADGVLVRAFTAVRAYRFALDAFNDVYTLNTQSERGQAGPEQYAHPTVSLWVPFAK